MHGNCKDKGGGEIAKLLLTTELDLVMEMAVKVNGVFLFVSLFLSLYSRDLINSCLGASGLKRRNVSPELENLLL